MNRLEGVRLWHPYSPREPINFDPFNSCIEGFIQDMKNYELATNGFEAATKWACKLANVPWSLFFRPVRLKRYVRALKKRMERFESRAHAAIQAARRGENVLYSRKH